MRKSLPALLCDYYKITHPEQYPENTEYLYAYYTPRMSRIEGSDTVIFFGLQYFIRTYLVDDFNENFFGVDKQEVLDGCRHILDNTLGELNYDIDKIGALWDLGFLPLRIRALPEGSIVPMQVPLIEISNTHPDFAWLVNRIESLLSSETWKMFIAANVGKWYRNIATKWAKKAVDSSIEKEWIKHAMGDFSFRGQDGLSSAERLSAAFLLSFVHTATVPAISFLEYNYDADCSKEEVGFGSVSTEHSVMCSNTSVDGDEITMVKRLLTEKYKDSNFSMVSDSYDYWKMVTEIIPACEKEIIQHNGVLSIRGDSGDPVEILAGKKIIVIDNPTVTDELYLKDYFEKYYYGIELEEVEEKIVQFNNKFYKVTIDPQWTNERGAWTDQKYWFVDGIDIEVEQYELTPEDKGTVQCLWEEFGGSINDKGYKVLNSKIRAIYGDSITQNRAEQIYSRLVEKGFAPNNVVLGVGSFSFQCLEMPDGSLQPFTRDTYGIAVKTTNAVISDREYQVFKNPKTDTGNFKKSQKGCVKVVYDNEKFYAEDRYQCDDPSLWDEENELKVVFIDGVAQSTTLAEIRKRLYGEDF